MAELSKKRKKDLKHVTLPWGIEPQKEPQDKLSRESMVKKSPPPRRETGQADGAPEVPIDISNIYPDDDVDRMATEEKKTDSEEVIIDEDVSIVPEGSADLDVPQQDALPIEVPSVEELHVTPLSSAEDSSPEVPSSEIQDDDEMDVTAPIAPEALERKIAAVNDTEDQGKLRFILAISGVVLAGVIALLGVYLYSIWADAPQPAPSAEASIAAKKPAVPPPPSAPDDSPAPPKDAVASAQGAEPAAANVMEFTEEAVASEKAAPEPESEGGDQPEDGERSDKNSVSIGIGGVPRGGEVLINGKVMTRPYYVPKSEKAIKIEVRAPGYVTSTKRVVPNRDKVVSVHMKKLKHY